MWSELLFQILIQRITDTFDCGLTQNETVTKAESGFDWSIIHLFDW